MKEKQSRRSFDSEFKHESIGLIMVEGRSVAETARNIGVHENTLYKWLREFKEDPDHSFPGKGHLKPEEEELRRLRRENASLKEDSAILKKALAIFSKHRV